MTMQISIKKIIFIIPSYSDDVINNYTNSIVLPYGVLSLASYLEAHCSNVKCKVLDFNIINGNVPERLEKELIEFKPDMVALSVMYNACKKHIGPFAKIIKEVDPEVFLIVGGIIATNMTNEVIGESKLIDAVCYGEGEIPLRDIINSDDISMTLKKHPSLSTPFDYKAGKNISATFVENLDDIPPLNYSIVDFDKYKSRISSKDGEEKTTLPIHSTRGCPFDCIFCCSAANHGKKIRYMSAKRFLSDVRYIINNFNITKISIDDDQFLFNRDRAIEILKGLVELNIEIEMANGLSVKFIDNEIASLLKKAGLKIAVLAIESGSPYVLNKIIKKPLKLEQVATAVKALKKNGISVHTFFIIGFPGETQEDRNLTRELILDIGFDWNNIFIATPYQGSRLYELCVENGYLSNNDTSESTLYQCRITAPGIDPEEITRKAYLLNLDVNFVNNSNFSHGFYEKAKNYFKAVADKYPSHAFAHYFFAQTLEKIKDSDKTLIAKHYEKYEEIIRTNDVWNKYSKYFKIAA